MQKSLLLLFFCLMSIFWMPLSAQEVQQIIRGQVRDSDTGRPLAGATVALPAQDLGVITNSEGIFRFPAVPTGRYQLQISYLGYEAIEIPELLVTSGKETVLDIALRESASSLSLVTVRAPRLDSRSVSPQVRTLSLEETLRSPATFFDPARMASVFPGVVATNDQANHLAIRGNSPNALSWRLEGLEIVNPNHTANAGTLSDRATVNGGGVNALSAQLLDNSLFFTGAFPAGYGNALSGVLDMRLRPGNNEKAEQTLQVGLIGIDIAAEGPFRKGSNASYLVNYRYSFTGLLSDLGVPLGDEDIRFQDLSFNLVFPTQRGGKLAVFGLLGQSSNKFTGKADSLDWETEKDLFARIDFGAQLGAAGLSFQQPLGKRGQLSIVSGWSATTNERLATSQQTTFLPYQELDHLYSAHKYAARMTYRHKAPLNGNWDIGLEISQQAITNQQNPILNDSSVLNNDYFSLDKAGVLLQGFGNRHWLWGAWKLQLGLHLIQYAEAFGGQFFTEPRATLEYQASPKHVLSASYGLHSQLLAANILADQLSRAHHLVGSWTFRPNSQMVIQSQVYYQSLFDVAQSDGRSALNVWDEFLVANEPTELGQGRNYGLELSWQKFAGDGWFYQLNTTLYRALYALRPGQWQASRYDGRYATAATVGKEWSGVNKTGLPRRLGVNTAWRWNGGLRQAPLDVTNSQLQQNTIYDERQGFTTSLPAYFRIDLRLYYQIDHPGWNSTLALDIQNVSNQQNVAYDYYDRWLGRVERRYQLELIPVLSYRLSF